MKDVPRIANTMTFHLQGTLIDKLERGVMDVETEVTVKGVVTCHHCGWEFEAEITDTVTIEVEPPDDRYDRD